MYTKILKDSEASRKAWESRRRGTKVQSPYGETYLPSSGLKNTTEQILGKARANRLNLTLDQRKQKAAELRNNRAKLKNSDIGPALAQQRADRNAKVILDHKKLMTTAKRIARYTDENDHGLAIATAAKLLGLDAEHKAAMKIRKDQLVIGHLSTELKGRRDKVYDTVMSYAKKNLSPSQYRTIYSAM